MEGVRACFDGLDDPRTGNAERHDLLKMLSLEGGIVTVDALNTQREIAQQVINQKGNYVMALKGDQGTLHDDVRTFLEDPQTELPIGASTIDGEHGRVETRTGMLSTGISWLQNEHHWPGLAGKVIRVRETANKTTTETAYYLLSTVMAPERFGEVVRSHWATENRLHWCLDVTMNGDQARSRMGHAPQNLAILRRMALNFGQADSATNHSECPQTGKAQSANRPRGPIRRPERHRAGPLRG